MSEGAAEGGGDGGGAPLSDGQFGDVTGTGDIPVPGQTAQDPGTGVFSMGYYPWSVSQRPQARSRKKRRKHRR